MKGHLMNNIDPKKLENWLLSEIINKYLDLEKDGAFSNLDRSEKQLRVARLWTAAVLETLFREQIIKDN